MLAYGLVTHSICLDNHGLWLCDTLYMIWQSVLYGLKTLSLLLDNPCYMPWHPRYMACQPRLNGLPTQAKWLGDTFYMARQSMLLHGLATHVMWILGSLATHCLWIGNYDTYTNILFKLFLFVTLSFPSMVILPTCISIRIRIVNVIMSIIITILYQLR